MIDGMAFIGRRGLPLCARPSVQARPGTPTVAIQPDEHPLGLGGSRDGTLYTPRRVGSQTSVPLIALMHG